MRRPAGLALAGLLLLAACTGDDAPSGTTGAPSTAAPSTGDAGGAAPLEVVLVWHQHQPRYPVVDGVVSRPWVRAHAAKDYLDMARLAGGYEDLRVTFNLTPSLLTQLDELASGRQDRYEQLTRVPAAELAPPERAEVIERFFDTNPKVIDRFPRYRELAGQDRSGFTDDDVRDLQVLWNLAWTDPSFLGEAPLAELVARGRDFTEADKATVLAVHHDLVARVVGEHERLWAEGRIEVSTTPLAHPILPLLADTSVAAESDPQAVLPDEPFTEYRDAARQVSDGLAVAEEALGSRPAGMWPGEGAVGQDVVKTFSDEGVRWIATGEDVLARSLGRGSFERDEAGDVVDAATLYRPYLVRHGDEPPVAVFFRDTRLADLIGFEYSGRPAAEAVGDLIGRLGRIRDRLVASGGPGPFVVPIVLDGENAWESYEDDGRPFLTALYDALTTTPWLRTTTPSQYLEDHAVPDLGAPLAAGSWIGGTLATWIGEEEEARAWTYLRAARLDLRRAEQLGADPAAVAAATEPMLWAEGSDWFWWYGDDQDSGDDAFFDGAFRELLGQVYDALGEPRPAWVGVPVTATAPEEVPLDGGGTATVTGDAGTVAVTIAGDDATLALPAGGAAVYVGTSRGGGTRGTTAGGRVLGFWAQSAVVWDGAGPPCLQASLFPPGSAYEPACRPLAGDPLPGGGLAVTLPVTDLVSSFQTGDRMLLRVEGTGGLSPVTAPAAITLPDIGGFDVVLEADDPEGDDDGPGGYTYPTDPVFVPGSFDLTGFQLGATGEEVVLVFDVAAPIANPWGSPTGLSVQTFDVYFDRDPGAGTGDTDALAGRNATVPAGWDVAVTVEGWSSKVVRIADDGSRVEERPTISVAVLGEEGRVVVRVPRRALGLGDDDLSTWRAAVAVLSQEGYPSPGVDRVRDVGPVAERYTIGGGTGAASDTRVLDALGATPPELAFVP